MNEPYKAEVELLVENVIDRLIEIKNPGLGDDALVEAYEDVDQREEAIEDILEYLDVESPTK